MMSGSKPHTRKCSWLCLLADRSAPNASYLRSEGPVYCRCLNKDILEGEDCPIFPSPDFDLEQVKERYDRARR